MRKRLITWLCLSVCVFLAHGQELSREADGLYLSTIDTTECYFGNPKPSLKTNLLGWALLAPNLGVEFYLGKDYTINHYSINLEGNYTRISLKGGARTYRYWTVSPEFRYYLAGDNSFTGHYLGLYAHVGEYSLMVKEGKGRQGDYYGVGVSYGWIKTVSRHLDLELGLGVGWVNSRHDRYGWYAPCYPYVVSEHKNFFSLTKAKIGLIYRY